MSLYWALLLPPDTGLHANTWENTFLQMVISRRPVLIADDPDLTLKVQDSLHSTELSQSLLTTCSRM